MNSVQKRQWVDARLPVRSPASAARNAPVQYAGDPLGTRGEAFSRRHKLGVLRYRRRIQTTGNEQGIDGRGGGRLGTLSKDTPGQSVSMRPPSTERSVTSYPGSPFGGQSQRLPRSGHIEGGDPGIDQKGNLVCIHGAWLALGNFCWLPQIYPSYRHPRTTHIVRVRKPRDELASDPHLTA